MPTTLNVAPKATTRVRVALLGLLLTVLALLPLAAPSGAQAMDKGLMDETLARSDNAANRARFFKAVKASKVKFVRTYIEWDGEHQFPLPNEILPIRRLAMEAKAAGVTTLHVDFTGTLGTKYDDAREIDLEKYQALVASTVTVLKDLPINIVYSPWNESNYGVLLPLENGPEVWRKMQNFTYDIVKALQPEAKVAVGELAPYARNKRLATDPGVFLRKALGLSASLKPLKGTTNAEYAVKGDVFTLHPYDYKRDPNKKRKSKTVWTVTNLPQTISTLKKIARTGRLSAEAPKNVIGTEFAYLAGTSQKISEKKAATYLGRAWRKAKRAGLKGFLWFQLKDPPTGTFKSGLTTNTNRERRVLKVFKRLK